MNGQDLTKGDIKKELWSLAWPMMLSIFFYTLYNLVDAYWVSKLSAEAIAAVSISQITLFIMVALSMGITVGSGVIMAMDIGAKNIKAAERVLGQSFVLSVIAGVIFTAISLIFRHELLTVSGAAGAIYQPAFEYFTITAGGSALLFIMMTVMFAFNAQGDTFTLTKLFAISTLVNVVLDPLLIFGYWGFPALGVAGAAWATLISQVVLIVVALYSLSRPHRIVAFHFRNLSFKWESVKKVLNIGIPASLTQVINPIGVTVLTLITSRAFLEPGTIAFSLGFRAEFIAFLPAVGFGFGGMAMMGQSIGAGNMERVRQIFNVALKYSFFAALGLGALVAIFGGNLIGAFTTDAVVTKYTQSYLWIVALSYGFLAATTVQASAFQGMGRSWPGFWILFLKFIVVSVPLSYLFSQVFHWPIASVWAAIAAGNVAASLVGQVWITKALRKFDLKHIPIAE